MYNNFNKMFRNRILLFHLITAAVVVIWGITFVCTKQLLNYFSAFEILVIRFVLAYIFLCFLYPHKIKLTKFENLLLALAGLTGVVLYQFTENLALNYTTASNVSIIVAICPIFCCVDSFSSEVKHRKYRIIFQENLNNF